MAQIKTYEAGNQALKPTEVGVEAAAAAGRRQGTFFNQLGAGQQELGRDEGALGRETGQFGREVGGFARELGHETAQLGSTKAHALIEWGKGLGSGIEAGGHAAVAYQTSKDVSAGSKAFADFTLAKQKELNETLQNADPNDPSVVKNFMDGLNTDLDKLKSQGFVTDKGQQWAELHADHIRNTFQAQAQSGISTMADAAFKNNQRGEMNSLSQSAYEGAPLPELIAQLESGVAAKIGSSPNLKGPNAAGLHGKTMQEGVESLVKAAAQGHIDRTGTTPEWLNDPQYSKYINAAELHSFERSAQATNKRIEADAKSAERNQKALDQQNGKDAADRLFSTWKNEDGSLNLPKNFREQIWNDPAIRKAPAFGRELIREYDSIEKGQRDQKFSETSRRTTQDLDAKIRSGEIINGDKIRDAFDAGKLTRSDYDWLTKKVNDGRTETGEKINKTVEEFTKAVKTKIIDPLNVNDDNGPLRMFEFKKHIEERIQDYRAKGKNWTELFNRDNPDSIYNDIPKYQYDAQKAVTSKANALPPKPPAGVQARNPGESLGDFLKRSGSPMAPAAVQ